MGQSGESIDPAVCARRGAQLAPPPSPHLLAPVKQFSVQYWLVHTRIPLPSVLDLSQVEPVSQHVTHAVFAEHGQRSLTAAMGPIARFVQQASDAPIGVLPGCEGLECQADSFGVVLVRIGNAISAVLLVGNRVAKGHVAVPQPCLGPSLFPLGGLQPEVAQIPLGNGR